MTRLLTYCAFCLFIFSSQLTYGAHVMGADVTYKYIDTMKYEVTVTYYRDCSGTPLDVGNTSLYCPSTGAQMSFTMTRKSITDITPLCDTLPARCNPANKTAGEGIEAHVYTAIIDFNTTFSSMKSCCVIRIETSASSRSSKITTGPSGTLYTYAELDLCAAPINSSPTFNSNPITIQCCSQPAFYELGASDLIDGDSLSYAWASAKSGRNKNASYTLPYTFENPISSYYPGTLKWPFVHPKAEPPIGIYLDPRYGEITNTPSNCNQTSVIVVDVTEWRKDTAGIYQKIGITRRDIQLSTISCRNNNPPRIKGPFIHNACEGREFCFTVSTEDLPIKVQPPDTSPGPDSVKLSWINNIPGSTLMLNDPNALAQSAEFCWTPPIGSTRNKPYSFLATALDNACPINISSSKRFIIKVSTVPETKINKDTLSCGMYTFTSLLDTSTSVGGASYHWEVRDTAGIVIEDEVIASFQSTNNTKSYSKSDTLRINRTGTYVVQHTIANHPSNCAKQYLDTITIDSVLQSPIRYPKDSIICSGSNISLESNPEFANGLATFQWFLNDTTPLTNETLDNLTINNIDSSTNGKYGLRVQDTFGCLSYDWVTIESYIFDNPFSRIYEGCKLDTIALKIDSMFSDIQWNDGSTDSVRIFTESDSVSVIYRDTFSCSYRDTIKLAFFDQPSLAAIDTISFCETDSVDISNDSISAVLWENGDTALPTARSGFHTFLLRNSFGCSSIDSVYLQFHKNPSLSIGSDTSDCTDSLELTYDASNYKMLWSTGDTTAKTWINATGNYSLQITDSNGCSSIDTFSVNILSNKNALIINRGADGFYSSLNGTHIWFNNSIIIPGESKNYLITNDLGEYSAIHVDRNGCLSDTSNILSKTVSVSNINKLPILIYPNPSRGRINIDLVDIPISEVNSIKLYDATGRIIETNISMVDNTMVLKWIASTGILWLSIETEKGNYRREIIYIE